MEATQPHRFESKYVNNLQCTLRGIQRKSWNKRLSSNELLILISLTRLLVDRRLLENQMFQHHLERIRNELETLPGHVRTRSFCSRSDDNKPNSELVAGLNFEQKCLIARSYREEYKRKCHHLKQKHKTVVEKYTASIEALKLTTKEVARNMATFNRTMKMFLPTDNTAAHQTSDHAARFVKFHKIYLRRLDALEQNLRVENSNIQKSCRKMRFYAKQREHFEMPRGTIDFEHINVCCEEARSTLLNKNDELARMKVFVNKVGRELGRYRTELSNEMETSVKLKNDMNHTVGLIRLIQNEVQTYIQHVNDEICNTTHIKVILAKYKVPSTSEYIRNLEEMAALIRDNVAENRKKSLAEFNLQKHRRLWSQIKLGRTSITSRSTICSKPRLSQKSHKEASHSVRLQ